MALSNISAKNCCGCRACEKVCPQECIVMKTDVEGFLISDINNEKCINCGLCEKVCPVINSPQENQIIDIYAMQNKNKKVLAKSSSGGAFRFIADYIINAGGIVCSCYFDDNNMASFTAVTQKNDLDKFQGSKYVQSDTKDIFISIKNYLNKGTMVFFSGSPCQCAALKNYLKKEYNNLYTADFLCHGMPSSWIFKEYICYLENKKRIKVCNISFRDKSARGWGLWFSYNQIKNNKTKKIIRNASVDPYEFAFQKSMMNRYLCYNCPFQGKRFTDFTYADYWGGEKFHPEIDWHNGVSILSINTEKAKKLIDENKEDAILIKTTVDKAAIQNESLINKENRPIPVIRKTIYQDVNKYGWELVGKRVLNYRYYWLNKIWYSLPHQIINYIKKNK